MYAFGAEFVEVRVHAMTQVVHRQCALTWNSQVIANRDRLTMSVTCPLYLGNREVESIGP
jgi:hypothetical protein